MAAGNFEDVKKGVWSVEEWNHRWEKAGGEWDEGKVDKYLIQFEEKLFSGRNNVKVFFPLCGKTPDMKWTYDKGHEVVGVDCLDDVLIKFFGSNNMKYTSSPMPSIGGTLYKSEDGKIRLYACNFLKFNSDIESNFGAVWDSGSISSVNMDDLPKYCDLMKKIVTPDCKYIMHSLNYDNSVYPGPPHSLSMEKLKSLFGDKFSMEVLHSYDMMKMMEEWVQYDEGTEHGHDQHHHGDDGQGQSQDQTSESGNQETSKKDERALLMEKLMTLDSMIGTYYLLTVM